MQGYKHDGATRTPATEWITSISEDSDWLAANDPCTLELGAGWRIPTYTEWYNADGAPQNWGNYNDTYASVLKLHAAGLLVTSNGSLSSRGTDGYYWSSTQHGSSLGYDLHFTSGISSASSFDKAYGLTLRCLKD